MTHIPEDGKWPCQTTPLQHPTPPRLVPFLFRLLRDGADSPAEVEQHAIAVTDHSGHVSYVNKHIQAYAESLAAFLLTAPPGDSSSGVTADNAATMPQGDFVRLLGDLARSIAEGDSMEGSLAYEWGEEPETYKVNAALRIGNAVGGQGGMRLVNEHTYPRGGSAPS